MIFFSDIKKLESDFYKSAYEGIAFHFCDKQGRTLRKDSLCARLILTYIFNTYYEIYDFVIENHENGKPFLKNDKLYFNISHSGDYVICAISENEVGCDIQCLSQYKQRVAERFFHENEVKLLLNTEDKDKVFTKLWTLKESVLKNKGVGISGGLDTYDFSQYIDKESFSVYGFNFFTTQIKDYSLSVCCKNISFDFTEISAEKIKDYFIGKE